MTLEAALEGMDPDIRPQDDLFGHVNGRWLRETEIPADKAGYGSFSVLADTAEVQVRAIIEDLAAGGAEVGSDAQKIGDLYASFMDEAAVESAGVTPVAPLIAAVDALRDVADIAAFLGEFERIGGRGLFGSYIDTDDKNSDRYLLNIAQGGIGLPDKSYYFDDKFADIRAAYVTYLEKLLALAGIESAAADATVIMALDTRLAGGHWERAETRDVQKTYNLTTFAELKSAVPNFDWDAYVRNLSAGQRTADDLLAEVIVREPSFLDHLSKTLAEVGVEDFKAWLRAHVVRWAAPYLSAEVVETNFDFYSRTLSGTPELRERWKRGVGLVEGGLGEAVGREYVARHFPPSSKAKMDELVANLLAAYRSSISKLDWMTEATKVKAYDKLDTFTPKIGYPVKFRDYSALTISKSDLIGNVIAISVFETDRQLDKIGSPVDRDEWFMLPQTVNAYYNPGTNEICFPAGILQPPFFSPDASDAQNYGAIGAVIGHEVGHGFDDQGAQYDGAGNMENWWTEEDQAAFEVKTKALIDQYDGFEPRNLPGEHVNGALTVGENIGDLGGLTIAHTAYVMSQGGSASEDDRRELFISWAYAWRTKARKELELQLLTADPHSPAEFRANIVRNLDEYHEVFGTQPGDGLWLEPSDRVRIW